MINIGILTFHRSYNYGAYLQAYALVSRLNYEEDIRAELIDYRMCCDKKSYSPFFLAKKRIWEIPHYVKRASAFRHAQKELLRSKPFIEDDDYNNLFRIIDGKYDVIIAGSDEIWRLGTMRGFPNAYWLPNSISSLKMSYAASSRSDLHSISEEDKKRISNILNTYKIISVRDNKTRYELYSVLHDNTIIKSCDPVFLIDFGADKERGKKILQQRFGINPQIPIVGLMGRSNEIVKTLKKEVDNEIQIVSLFEYNYGIINTPSISPFEWVDVLASLDFLITFMFHGACFAIKYEIPFIGIETRAKDRETSKLFALAEDTECPYPVVLGTDEALRESTLINEIRNGCKRKRVWEKRETLLNEYQESFTSYCDLIREGIKDEYEGK